MDISHTAAIRISKVLLTIPLIATIFVALTRATVHFELDWPVHAQHHLIHQIVLMIGISLVGLIVLYGPLGKGETWAWWVLLLTGIAIHGGYWLGHPIVGLGEPGTVPNTAQGILSALYGGGLLSAWIHLHKQPAPGSQTNPKP